MIQKDAHRVAVERLVAAEKEKVYLGGGEKPPRGVDVQEGPRGGRFYESRDVGRIRSRGRGRAVSGAVEGALQGSILGGLLGKPILRRAQGAGPSQLRATTTRSGTLLFKPGVLQRILRNLNSPKRAVAAGAATGATLLATILGAIGRQVGRGGERREIRKERRLRGDLDVLLNPTKHEPETVAAAFRRTRS